MLRRLLIRGLIGATAGAAVLYWPLAMPEPQGPAYQQLPKAAYEQHPNRHVLSKVPGTVGIIGGGASGLITAKVLQQQGYTVQILEKRDHIGGVWYNNYEGAGLQVPYFTYNMPDFVFPPSTPLLPKQDVILRYFERYVEEFKLQDTIKLNTQVSSITQLPDHSWELTFENKSKQTYDFLVLCNGTFFYPYIPEFKGKSGFKGVLMHSSQFKNAKGVCSGKKVVVIGAGKSAMDIVEIAAEYATAVTQVMRKPHWYIPFTFQIFGLHPGYTMYSRFFNLLKPAVYGESGWINWALQPVSALYWKFIGERLVEGLPKHMHPDVPLVQELDTLVTRTTDYTTKVQNGLIAVKRGEIDHFEPNGVVTSDGSLIEADVVVLATGFKRNYFSTDTEEGEQWRYRGILKPGLKNFAVIGNLTTTNTMLITNLQAVWLAEMLRGKVTLPSEEDMKKDVQNRKEHMKKLHGKNKKNSFIVQSDCYCDEMIGDMGLQTRRSPRWLEHWFSMPPSTDYRSILTHRV